MFGELEEAVLSLKIKGEAWAESFGRPSTCVNFSTMQEHKKALVRSDGNSEISHLTASSLSAELGKRDRDFDHLVHLCSIVIQAFGDSFRNFVV